MSKRTNKSSLSPAIIVALITTIGVVIGAYFNYRSATRPYEIAASQTVEAFKISLSMTSTPAPIPTPTFTPTNQPREWYVIFSREFPAGYWKEGIHKYLFDADCPFSINSTKDNEPSYSITVKPDVELQSSTVYIRRGGLYLVETFGTSIGDTLNPLQTTTAIYGPLALTFDDAKRLQKECKVRMSIDDGEFLDLSPTRIDKISN